MGSAEREGHKRNGACRADRIKPGGTIQVRKRDGIPNIRKNAHNRPGAGRPDRGSVRRELVEK